MDNILVSIVTGTYNRINYLKRLMKSIRDSIGVGVRYEVIIVDGGSIDGTQDWCKKQSDIRLIEQGQLLGACKAFNAGAMEAKGIYTILANDDIEFVNESILSAIAFMEDNPKIGIGCFWQDRGGRPWYVDTMPAVYSGKSVRVYYGQVCIIPTWLGNKLGWWGDYHTYAGDNELSCNVIEAGLDIQPIPCACIHDDELDDELRRVNKGSTRYSHGGHPDSHKWVSKWTRNGLLGPEIPASPNVRDVSRHTRVMYLPIYEQMHAMVQHKTKRGLREALTEAGYIVYEMDYLAYPNPHYLFDLSNAFKPDIFLCQFHDSDWIGVRSLRELKAEHPEAIFVNWNGDYSYGMLHNKPTYIQLLKEFHLATFVTTSIIDEYAVAGIRSKYWQIGYEETSGSPPDADTPVHDVVLLGNGYSPKRVELGKRLRSLKCNVGIYGDWRKTDVRADGQNLYDFEDGAKIYKAAKIAIGDSQYPEATGYVSNRLFQMMEAGAFVLHQNIPGADWLLGIKDGVHLVSWSDFDDLEKKVGYYLDHPEVRSKIARKGQEFCKINHSFKVRVVELGRLLGDICPHLVMSR